MRRHAKASSAGSNSGRAASRRSFRRPGALVFLLAVLAASACVLPGSALAAETRLEISSFGPDGTPSTQFGFPGAIGIDQGTHDIYVADYGSGTIDKFDQSGTPADFSALGSNEIGGFSFFSGLAFGEIAVNSTSHNFYVADYGNGVIKAFQQDGEAANFSAGPGAGTNELPQFGCGVAVDANGAIYIGDSGSRVHVFAPDGEELTSFAVSEPCNLAVDASGNVYAARFFFFSPGVEKLTPSEFPVTASTTYASAGEAVGGNAAFAVAVDPSSSDLYADFSNRIGVYGSSGAKRYEFGALEASEGFALDAGTGKAYAGDGADLLVHVFGPPILLPDATSEDADPVTATTATLHGTINPNGKQLSGCRFEYLTDAGFHAKEVQKLTVSATAGTFTLSFEGAGTPALPFNAPASEVEKRLNGLSTLDNNVEGKRAGVNVSGGPGDGAGSAPYTITFGGSLAYQDVAQITADAAGLSGGTASAQITTTQQGVPDSYASATSVPCEPTAASIPPDSSGHAVKADISGLDPNTTYHFRLIAETAEGSGEGEDRVLTTAAGAPTVSEQSVASVSNSGATLSAKINPKGAKTTYHLEYGTTAAYGQSTPESAPIGFGGDESNHVVSVHVDGLKAGTAYHFRFVATSIAGDAQGTDTSFATYPASPGFRPCPNDQLRTGFGAALPDCRAYEQATPTDKHGANVQGATNLIEASAAGDRITFYLNGGLPSTGGTSTLSAYMASRGAGGWSSDGVLHPTDPGFASFILGWSEDLATTAVRAPGPGNVGEAVYLRDSATAAFQTGLAAKGFNGASIAGFAADTSHLLFETENALAPGGIGFGPNLYDLDHGNVTLAGRIPAGAATSCDDESGPACIAPPEGSFAGPYDWRRGVTTRGGASQSYYTQNTISRDGSRVFFTAAGSGQLYVREDGTRTTRISASQRTAPDPNGDKPAVFVAATPDGSKVFFLSCEKLTDDSTAFSSSTGNFCGPNEFDLPRGQDLYSYDVESGELTDLSVDSNVSDPKGADVQGILGISDDGSYVYFVANGELAPGASLGSCPGLVGGECNLYVSHEGTVGYVATLDGSELGDGDDWRPDLGELAGTPEPKTARVSTDGQALLFSSRLSLTGYDSTPAKTTCGTRGGGKNRPCAELFRYSAPSEELDCVSCNPAGLRPNSAAVLGTPRLLDLVAPPQATFLTRNLSADGKRVFFDSTDALVPSDTNGVNDVYEWEAKGSGSCESESQDGGCIYLLSSGTSPDPSYFADASTNGDRAFFFTSQSLVPSDGDELIDIYGTSVDGGLAAQHALSSPTCTSTACQANPPPPPDQGTASAVFSGPGNAHKPPAARKCPKGKRKVRRAGKVSCQKAHKQHKRHNNRGGSK